MNNTHAEHVTQLSSNHKNSYGSTDRQRWWR